MPPLNTQILPEASQVAFRAIFDTSKLEQSSKLFYSKMGFVDREAEGEDEQINAWTGPGRATLSVEGEQYKANSRQRSYPVAAALRKYTSELVVTEDQLHWLQKGQKKKMISEVTDMMSGAVSALNYSLDDDAAKVLYLGHGSSFLTCGNSEALFGSHTIRKTGATQRNTFASGDVQRPLTSSALVDAINLMNRFKNHNDVELLPTGDLLLVVPKELSTEALRIIKSDYGPSNANLGYQGAGPTIQAGLGRKITVFENPYIPSSYSTYWFLIDVERAKASAFMDWAWKPRMQEHWEYRKGNFFNDSSTKFGPLVLGSQWAFSSKGNGDAI